MLVLYVARMRGSKKQERKRVTVDDIAKEDERLLALLAQCDATALEALYDRHAPALYALILRILADATIAQEVLIDTFWQVWQQAGNGCEMRHTSQLYVLARQNSIALLRREAAALHSRDEVRA